MKITIRDGAALSAVSSEQIESYLRGRGWNVVNQLAQSSIWALGPDDDGGFEVLVPRSAVAADYSFRVADVLNALEQAEARSQAEILEDITVGEYDILRLAVSTDQSGRIPVEEGLVVFGRARDAILAAACATVERKPVFPGRKPVRATDYLARVLFGQTERGSFVITVQSPTTETTTDVEPEQGVLEAVDAAGINHLAPIPFGRRTVRTLVRAIVAASEASESEPADRQAKFSDAVKVGLTANLCDAVAEMLGAVQGDEVKIDVSWAPLAADAVTEPSSLTIKRAWVPALKEAATMFRARQPRPNFQFSGLVIRLKRPKNALYGKATILGKIDEEERTVSVQLSGGAYERLTEAHRDAKPVTLRGELAREGRGGWVLHAPELLDG